MKSEENPEGIVFRVETAGEFRFMAKWVRQDHISGKYFNVVPYVDV